MKPDNKADYFKPRKPLAPAEPASNVLLFEAGRDRAEPAAISYDDSYLPPLNSDSKFPLESVSQPLRGLIAGAASYWATHPSYIMVAMIGFVLCLIGKRVTLRVGDNHTEYCSLVCLIIGPSRGGKSRAITRGVKVIGDIQSAGKRDRHAGSFMPSRTRRAENSAENFSQGVRTRN